MCLAVPGQLLEITDNDPVTRRGKVSFGGAVKEVGLACVPEVRPGDFVIVHAGFALSVLDQEEAGQVFEYLREMGDLAEVEEGEP